MDRRTFCRYLAVTLASAGMDVAQPNNTQNFRLRYIVGSSMYGKMLLSEILPEVRKMGSRHIDIWPEHHANQREQIEAMGHERFAAMLRQHEVELGIITRYDLGPFGLQDEMQFIKKLGGSMVICGARGSKDLKGQALKTAVREFVETMKPHIDAAERLNVTIGIENHANSLIDSPDSIRWFAELSPSRFLGIALAPYHLPQNPGLLAGLIADLDDRLVHFYAWQHGMGCHKKLPKHQELMQLPGRGELDFVPIVAALRRIDYTGWTEVFMHPVPRGIPILPTAGEVTAHINHARHYLEKCLLQGAKQNFMDTHHLQSRYATDKDKLFQKHKASIARGKIIVRKISGHQKNAEEYEAIGLIEGTLREVSGVLTDYASYPEFMPNVKEISIRDSADEGFVVDHKLGLPMGIVKKYRLKYWAKSEANSVQLFWKKRPWPELKPSQTIVDTYGQWILEDLSGANDQVLAYYRVYTDPGKVPLGTGWIVDLLTKESIPNMFKGTRRRVKQITKPNETMNKGR